MSEVARYQRGEQLRRDGDVVTSRGVDAVTGLAVFIYDFPGPPRAKPGQVVSDGVPAILAAGYDGARGVLVSANPTNATLVAPGEALVDDRFVLQALTTLRDTARAGLVHGDLHGGRLLWAHGKLYLEGYGVPWNPAALRQPTKEIVRAALARDLAAAVKALLEFGSSGMSAEVTAALKGALGNAIRAGDAAQLYTVIRRLAGGAVTVPPAGFGDLVLPTTLAARAPAPAHGHASDLESVDLDDIDLTPRDVRRAAARPPSLTADAPVGGLAPTPAGAPQGAGRAAPAHGASGRPSEPAVFETPSGVGLPVTPTFPDEPEPITLNSDPGVMLQVKQSGTRDSGGFVKDLPPGATYRAGNTEEEVRVAPIRFDVAAVPPPPKRAWRVPLLLLILCAVAAGGGYLALVARRDAPTEVQGTPAVNHIVDVRVSPANHPPVSLVVEQSPANSAHRPGTIIASVPRRVPFDANGVWTVYARFGQLRSESVTLRVPDDTLITFTIPAAGAP